MASIAERLLAQRQHWVEVAPGKRVRYLRPRETEFASLYGGITPEHVCQQVNGWEGFTEADLLGSAVGASDPAPFSTELWAEYVLDKTDVLAQVAGAIGEAVNQHLKTRADAAKN